MGVIVRRSIQPSSASVPIDPIFGLPMVKEIRLRAPHVTAATAAYLAMEIARNRSNLVAHLRRMWLHHDLGDAAGVTAAVIDFLIAVGDKGTEIRVRVLRDFEIDLQGAGCALPREVVAGAALSQHAACTERTGCVLGRPLQGGLKLIDQVRDDSGPTRQAPQEDWCGGSSHGADETDRS